MRPSGAGQSALLLLDAIAVLVREQIHYAVIGAMAASVHGARVAVGSPQYLSDARNAIAAAGGSLDLVLVRRLAKRYGREASDGLEKLLREP